MEFIFKLTQKTYKYYYNDQTGTLLARITNKGELGINFPSFTSNTKYNLETHRYNTETNTVEPVE
jgi:hypothetical protein